MSNSLATLSVSQLRRAIEIKRRIGALSKELASILGPAASAPTPAKAPKRRISAAGRARIAAAQKKRWAKAKAAPKQK